MSFFTFEEETPYYELVQILTAIQEGKIPNDQLIPKIREAEEHIKELEKYEDDLDYVYGQLKSHMHSFELELKRIKPLVLDLQILARSGKDPNKKASEALNQCGFMRRDIVNVIKYMKQIVDAERELLKE